MLFGSTVTSANMAIPPRPLPPPVPPTQPVDGPNKPAAGQKGVALLGVGASAFLLAGGVLAARRRRDEPA